LVARLEGALRSLLANWFNSEDGDFQGIGEVHEAKLTHSKVISFDLRFAEITELMAQAQRFGPTSGAQAQYDSLRRQLSSLYGELRPFLLAYLRFDLEDERVGIRTIGHGTDAFEAIWVHPNLQSFIDSDDVFFRDRVARANDAVKDYTEHLLCLLETRV
jgi:hypothetical protein